MNPMLRIAPARLTASPLLVSLALAAIRGAAAQDSAAHSLLNLDAARAVADEFPTVVPQGPVMPASFEAPISAFDAATPREAVSDQQLMQAGLELTDRYDESNEEGYDDAFDQAAEDAAWAEAHSRNWLKGFILGCIGCLGVLLALKWLGASLTASNAQDEEDASPTHTTTTADHSGASDDRGAATRDVLARRQRRRSRRPASIQIATQQPTWSGPITVASPFPVASPMPMPVPVPVAVPQPTAPLGYMPYPASPVYAPHPYLAGPPTYPMTAAAPPAEATPPAMRATTTFAQSPQPVPSFDAMPDSARATPPNPARTTADRSRYAPSAHARANRGPTANGRSTNFRTAGSQAGPPSPVNSVPANLQPPPAQPASIASSPDPLERERVGQPHRAEPTAPHVSGTLPPETNARGPQAKPSLPLPASSLFDRILADNRQVRLALDVTDL